MNTVFSADVLNRFVSGHQHKRVKFILNTTEWKSHRPDVWVNACISNWKSRTMPHEVLGKACVHIAESSRVPGLRSSPDRARPRLSVYLRHDDCRPAPRVQEKAAYANAAEEVLSKSVSHVSQQVLDQRAPHAVT